MARTEARLGAVSGLDAAYVNVGTASDDFNLNVNVTNRTDATVELRLYIAPGSWSADEPTGAGAYAIAYDLPIAAGDVVQISGVLMISGEKLIAHAGAADSLDIIASGVLIS